MPIKFFKKALSLGLAEVMTLGLMAGCGNSGDKNKGAASTADGGSGEAYTVSL